jgi:hypothetical protein
MRYNTAYAVYGITREFSLSDSPLLLENGRRLESGALKKKIRKLRHSFRPRIVHEVASALAFRQAEQKRLGALRDTTSPACSRSILS